MLSYILEFWNEKYKSSLKTLNVTDVSPGNPDPNNPDPGEDCKLENPVNGQDVVKDGETFQPICENEESPVTDSEIECIQGSLFSSDGTVIENNVCVKGGFYCTLYFVKVAYFKLEMNSKMV